MSKWDKPDFTKIEPEKLASAARYGMSKLLPRIEALRNELEPLQTAYIRLQGKKHFAEMDIKPVTFLKPDAKRTDFSVPKSPKQQVMEMSPKQRQELMAALKGGG